MGTFPSKLIASLNSLTSNSFRIVVLGLDGSGKTTAVLKVKADEMEPAVPTVGFNVETVSPRKGLTFEFWDIGGISHVREYWIYYLDYNHGLIYVVDSCDRQRFRESHEELKRVLSAPEMNGVPVVVLANKQDLPDAVNPSSIAEEFQLDELRDRKWHVQGTSALTGEGLYEALKILGRLAKEFKKKQKPHPTESQQGSGHLSFPKLNCLKSMFAKKPFRVLMLGLDAVGKTKALYRLKLNEDVENIPTIGFNNEVIHAAAGHAFDIWDIGSADKGRVLWVHYFPGTQGLIYVVNSCDRERLSESYEWLQWIFEAPDMKGVPAIILANKQDLPDALTPSNIIEMFKMDTLKDRKWHVQGTCATTGEGLNEAMDILVGFIKDSKKTGRGCF